MKSETPYKIDVATGEKVPYSKEELEGLELRDINITLTCMSREFLNRELETVLEPLRKKYDHRRRTFGGNHPEVAQARQETLVRIAREEQARIQAEHQRREAERGTPEEQDRARVLENFRLKVERRLSTMTPEDREAWRAEVNAVTAALTAAELRGDAEGVEIFTTRLTALDALPPAPDDIDALMEPAFSPAGIDLQRLEEQQARIRKQFGLDKARK